MLSVSQKAVNMWPITSKDTPHDECGLAANYFRLSL